MNRRGFLASAAVVTAWPMAARAQEVGRTNRLGFLTPVTRKAPAMSAFLDELVAEKLVASLARPGGNITGISLLSPELDGKRQDILIEAVPQARRLAALADANVTPIRHLQALQDAARTRGVTLLPLSVAGRDEIPAALHNAKTSGAEALNVLASPLFFVNRHTVIDGAAALRLPAIYQWPNMAEDGGFLAYGPRFEQVYRQRERIVVKLLRGAKAAEIPVEQPSVFELVVNLQTAKTIGHHVPEALIHRADKVIE